MTSNFIFFYLRLVAFNSAYLRVTGALAGPRRPARAGFDEGFAPIQAPRAAPFAAASAPGSSSQ